METAKIVAKVDKILKQIDPNSKKQITQLSEDSAFRKNIEDIKDYVANYNQRENFPNDVYDKITELTTFCEEQYKDITEKKEDLENQRKANIALAGTLNEVYLFAITREDFSEYERNLKENGLGEYIDSLRMISQVDRKSEQYISAEKTVKSKINNLETNAHIEIDLDRIADKEKVLSYISVELENVLSKVAVIDIDKVAIEVEEESFVLSPKLVEQYVPDTAQYVQYTTDSVIRVKNVLWAKIKDTVKSWFKGNEIQALGPGTIDAKY